jgi:hypothetical protein
MALSKREFCRAVEALMPTEEKPEHNLKGNCYMQTEPCGHGCSCTECPNPHCRVCPKCPVCEEVKRG